MRAGALLRRARILRRSNDLAAALQAYQELKKLGAASVEGLPAEAVALQASVGILETLGRGREAEAMALELAQALEQGRWRLDEAAFGFYLEEVSRRLQTWKQSEGLRGRVQLSVALKAAWGSQGRRLVEVGGVRYLFQRAGTGYVLLGPQWIERSWSAPAGIRLEARGPEEATGSGPVSVRYASATRLPWNVWAVTLDPAAELREAELRNRLLWIFLLIVTLLVAGVSYLMVRSVTRELTISRLQSDFVAAVSHEFRTPLTSLCQISELFAKGRVTRQEDQAVYHGILVRESQRLRRLVEGLLDFGQMEAGARDYRFATLDVAELARAVAAEFSAEHGAFGERLRVECGADTGTIKADRTALECVIWNLLDNAMKYGGAETGVWLKTGREGGRVWIAVEDQGPGVPVPEQGRIFEKFVRGKAARDANLRGSGIGLAMVKRIVEAHRGKIELKSGDGQGCRFRIELAGDGHGKDLIGGG
jgi:signal transduction histidine kinase